MKTWSVGRANNSRIAIIPRLPVPSYPHNLGGGASAFGLWEVLGLGLRGSISGARTAWVLGHGEARITTYRPPIVPSSPACREITWTLFDIRGEIGLSGIRRSLRMGIFWRACRWCVEMSNLKKPANHQGLSKNSLQIGRLALHSVQELAWCGRPGPDIMLNLAARQTSTAPQESRSIDHLEKAP